MILLSTEAEVSNRNKEVASPQEIGHGLQWK